MDIKYRTSEHNIILLYYCYIEKFKNYQRVILLTYMTYTKITLQTSNVMIERKRYSEPLKHQAAKRSFASSKLLH